MYRYLSYIYVFIRVINRFAVYFRYRKCKGCHENVENQEERLHYYVEALTDMLYLGDGINAVGGCEATVASRLG